MLVIKDLEVIDTRREQLTGLVESNAMLASVRAVLLIVPLDLHRESLSLRVGKSMAYR
jgi:hypothetical protein